MSTKEDFTLSVRSLLASPLESMLLVLGLALSIGATASGLGMFAKASDESKALLSQVEYREILVSSQESSSDMNVPISIQPTEESITLSVSDLQAADVSPSIEFAYLSDRSRLRFNTGDGGFGGQDQPAERESRDQPAENASSDNQDTEQSQERVERDENSQSNQSQENQNSERNDRPDFEFAEVEGPTPIIEELPAYEVTPGFFDAMNLSADEGSLFTQKEMEQGAKVLVLGSTAAQILFEDKIALGREVASFNNVFTIVGVLEQTGTSIDSNAYRPSQIATENNFRFRGAADNGATLHFTVNNTNDLAKAQAQLTQYFNGVYGENILNIQVPREAAEAASGRAEKIAVITLVLALAGLLIANVNVSNILYGRAIRRKKQVGILKALGASKQNIFAMFLKESGVLLVLGGLIGIAIALGFSSLIASNSQSGLPLYAVIIGIIVSCLITLVFTLVPAIQASKTAPANAMRVE